MSVGLSILMVNEFGLSYLHTQLVGGIVGCPAYACQGPRIFTNGQASKYLVWANKNGQQYLIKEVGLN